MFLHIEKLTLILALFDNTVHKVQYLCTSALSLNMYKFNLIIFVQKLSNGVSLS